MSGVDLHPVAATEKGALRQMILPYFAEIAPEVQDPPGQGFDGYWSEAGRWRFWIVARGERVGFALVRKVAEGFELAEFGILPGRRHEGIGTAAACALFRRFPGRWVLGIARRSPGGMAFWRRVLQDCPGVGRIVEGAPLLPLQNASLSFEMGDMR